MAKFKLDSPQGTPLDPFAFEKQFVKPNTNNPSPFSGVADQLEFVTPEKIDSGYGTLGNASYAQQVIAESRAANQSSLGLVAKGLFNVGKTVAIEALKTPGYFVGAGAAIGNELVGDGKQSMSYIVDNAWVNAFESLDNAAKEAVPVYMSKQVQEGGLLDKMGSGAWWAETGADGLGFMLAMFAPGAVAKALKIGSGIATAGEGLARIPGIGKLMTGAKMMEKVGEGFKHTTGFARNANGFASAVLNTTLESSAEAANTFDNLKSKYINEGLTEEEANQKAGEAASAVFKGNMALLAVSNVLDEMYIWKTIGSAGEKEAAESMLSKIFKDGTVDMEAVKTINKEFTTGKLLKRIGTNAAKNVAKEGFFEEGSQTLLQQNIEDGKKGKNVLEDLYNIGESYLTDFSDNKELHESIFLGGLLGAGSSVFGTVQENNALKASIGGGNARTKDNSIWAKIGLFPETKAQKGLATILAENHISQFKSYKDLMTTDKNGNPVIDEQKLMRAQVENVEKLRTNIMYDVATQQGDKLGQEIFSQYLAADYVRGFLGQEGGKELFDDHVEKQVLPAWQKRFEETFGREATSKEVQKYKEDFKQSGNRIFDAYETAESTNYPERYYHENTKEYQDFRGQYLHEKFETLVTLDSIKKRKNQISKELSEAGLTELDLEDPTKIKDPIGKQLAIDTNKQMKFINANEPILAEQYKQFFTKEGVKEMFEGFKAGRKAFEQVKQKLEEENKDLKNKVDQIPEKNKQIIEQIQTIAEQEGYTDNNIPLKDKYGNKHNLNTINPKANLEDLRLEIDDVSGKDFEEFQKTGKASDSILERIAKKLGKKEQLSDREKQILSKNEPQVEAIYNKLSQQAKQAKADISTEPISKVQEDSDPDENDSKIDEVYRKKKGVNLYPSTGRNVQDEFEEIEPDVFAEKLTDKPSQRLWFEVLDKEVKTDPTSYTVQVVRRDDKSNPELYQQIDRDGEPNINGQNDGDLYTVLYKNGQPVVKNGNYVFTGLWRPDTLYKVDPKTGKPLEPKLAESAIVDNFLFANNLKKFNFKNKISKADQDKLKLSGVKTMSNAGVLEAAFFWARDEYRKWYKGLQDNPSQLQVAGITKGHSVKTFSDKNGTNTIWGNPLKGIPGLKLLTTDPPSPSNLKGGKFKMSTTGTIKVGDDEFKINEGDVVIVDDNQNVHPLKARNLTEDEVKTVVYLLSLRSGTGATESIKVGAPQPIKMGNLAMREIPVFFNSESKGLKDPTSKARASLIQTLISFGSKNGGKGEIYFNKESIKNDTLLVWTDFNGQTHNLEVSKIKDAIDNNDFSTIEDLVVFLRQKRFNVNEHLLGQTEQSGNNIFSKPTLTYKRDTVGNQIPTLEWDQTKSYYEHLLNDVLTTTTKQLKDYPSRVQRNLWFNKQPIISEEFTELTWDEPTIEEIQTVPEVTVEPTNNVVEQPQVETKVEEPKKVKKKFTDIKDKPTKTLEDFTGDMDKIFTTSDLLKAKIQTGEIIQNCR